MRVTQLQDYNGDKGAIVRSSENCDYVAHAVNIGKTKDGYENTVFVEAARPTTFLGVFESQNFHSDETVEITPTQVKGIATFVQTFTAKNGEGKIELAPRVKALLQSYYDDLKLSISANVRSQYVEGVIDTVKPFADAFLAVLAVSPKLAAKSFADQYKVISALRSANEDEPLPEESVLFAKIEDIKAKKAARAKK